MKSLSIAVFTISNDDPDAILAISTIWERALRAVLFLIGFLASPLYAQTATTEERSPRQFYCSMVESAVLTEGDDYDDIHTEENFRPKLVLVPDPDALNDEFSENGRYYYYKKSGEGDLPPVLYGVFDLRLQRLVVGRLWMGTGRDDIERVYVSSVLWICSEID